MSRASYEAYGERARLMRDPLKASARLTMRRAQEKLIVGDIVEKLDLKPADRLLDIGCGIGNLTIPLSFLVADVLGVDHPDCVARLQRRIPEERVRVLAGNWLDLELGESFTKVLVYSVLHYLTNMAEVGMFVEKALKCLERGGAMLLGDLPSQDFRERFDNTPEGSTFNANWNRGIEASLAEEAEIFTEMSMATVTHLLQPDPQTMIFHDLDLLQLVGSIRKAGFDAWILPQDNDLPFRTQREDILVRRAK